MTSFPWYVNRSSTNHIIFSSFSIYIYIYTVISKCSWFMLILIGCIWLSVNPAFRSDGPQTNTSDKNLRPTFLDAPTHTSCFAGSNDPVAVGSNSSGGSLGQQSTVFATFYQICNWAIWNQKLVWLILWLSMTCVCFGTDYPPSAKAKMFEVPDSVTRSPLWFR